MYASREIPPSPLYCHSNSNDRIMVRRQSTAEAIKPNKTLPSCCCCQWAACGGATTARWINWWPKWPAAGLEPLSVQQWQLTRVSAALLHVLQKCSSSSFCSWASLDGWWCDCNKLSLVSCASSTCADYADLLPGNYNSVKLKISLQMDQKEEYESD
jgi:hypothetical protein